MWLLTIFLSSGCMMTVRAQINAEQVMRIGQTALHFEDYVLSIQYFNQAIQAKPYLAMPYFLRSIAKLNLEDYMGAEEDATEAIARNPFIADAFEVRGVARQSRGNSAGAIEDYNEALKLLPDNRGLLFNKALAQEDVKDYDGASQTYETLLKSYPRYENAYMGRARLQLAVGDTIAARADLDRAIELNSNLAGAHVMLAELAIKQNDSLPLALNHLDEAIKLLPKEEGLYINRAFIRYQMDDFRGALADYETSLSLEPINPIAYFNRGLLRMETLDNDRALTDFSQVLQLEPDNYRALYNRAMIYAAKKDYASAIADISRVVDAFPDFAGAVYARFTIYNEMGDRRSAMRDYDKAMEMFKNDRKRLQQQTVSGSSASTAASGSATAKPTTGADATTKATASSGNDDTDMKRETAEEVARRFTSLLTVDSKIEVDAEHNNKSIRGKIQDRRQAITMEPMFTVSYYGGEEAVDNSAAYYMQEVDRVNATRALRSQLKVVLRDDTPGNEDDISRHFQSIDYYNSYIATHTPRAIDYLGRALDFMMLYNYNEAITDLDRAIALTPDFTLAYFMRGVARYRNYKAREGADNLEPALSTMDRHIANARNTAALAQIISDFDNVIALSPRLALAYYNKACVLAETGNTEGAINALTQAINIEPGLGVAYYNRGYLYLQSGDSPRGTADLSRAGELGIVSSYNLLKRMHR